MGNQSRQNFYAGGFFGFQHGQPYQQHNQWRTHPDPPQIGGLSH